MTTRTLVGSRLRWNPHRRGLIDILLLLILCLMTPSVGAAAPPTTRPRDLPLGEAVWLGLQAHKLLRLDEKEPAVLTLSKTGQWFECYSHSVTKEQYQSYMLQHGERLLASEPFKGPFALPDRLPYPRSLADIPADDHGVRLSLDFSPADEPSAIRFNLLLSSSGRAVWAENDGHPFLIAFFIDGHPYVTPKQGQNMIDRMVRSPRLMIPKEGGERRWGLQVSQQSLRNLLPDEKPHKLTAVAVFSERDTMVRVDKEHFPDGSLPPEGHEGSQVLVRSNPAEIMWSGREWKKPEK